MIKSNLKSSISFISEVCFKILGTETRKIGIFYSLSSYSLNISKIITGIICLRWVHPENLGYWNSVIVLSNYLPILQLGVLSGLSREFPYLIGKGEIENAKKLSSTTLFVLLFIGSIILLSIFLYSFLENLPIRKLFIFFSVGVLTISNFLSTYITTSFRTNENFFKLGNIYFTLSLFYFLTLPFVYFFDLEGYIIRLLTLSFITVFTTALFNPFKVSPKFYSDEFKKLVKVGMRIYGIGYIQEIAGTLNRVIMVSISSAIIVGYYSPSLSVYSGIATFGIAISTFVYPKMNYDFGKFNNRQLLWKWVWKTVIFIAILSFPIIILSWVILPILFSKILPSYLPGLLAAKLSVISGSLESASIVIQLLFTLKAWRSLIFLSLLKLVIFFFSMYFLTFFYEPLLAVSLGLIFAQFLYLFLILIFCYKLTH